MKSRRRATSNSRKSERRNDSNDNDSVEASPPNTIAEWLNKLAPVKAERKETQETRPAQTIPASTPAPAIRPAQGANAPATKSATAPQPKSATAPVEKKVLPKSVQQVRPNPFPDRLPASEVLAINMSPAMMGRAQGLGFKLQQTTLLPSLDMTLQRLLPPPGMDAMRARDVLGQPGGNASVALNEVYRPIRAATATEPDGTPLRRTPQPAATGGCSAERCFGMKAIRWDTQLQSCSQGVRIGMIDTMVDQQHPALRVAFGDKRIEAQSFIGKGRRVAPSGHGTGILSILAGAAQSGTPGLVPNANFRVADIFHADANGQPLADTASLLAALDWMAKEQVKVVNLSVAGPHDELMERAIERLAKKDMIFVAAAGNEGPAAPPMYPAAYKSVIAVTAVAKDLRGYRQANRGDYIDAAAPGVDVWTALPDSKENFQSGTSFAVPFATAVVATVYAQVKHKTKESVLAAIEFKDLGLPGRDTVFGRGLMMAPQRCSGSGGEVARAPSFTPVMALPSGVGASSVGFGFASGKP